MKCEHNKEIIVIVQQNGKYIEDGLVNYTKDGKPIDTIAKQQRFLVSGCLICKTVKAKIKLGRN